MPGRQGEHTVLPPFSGPRPSGHSSQDCWLDRPWAQPAGQSRQVSSTISCLPALQAEHDALSLLAVRPALQSVQILAFGVSECVSFVHMPHSSWPVRLLALPGMHGRHDAELLSGWWKPTRQAEHVFEFWFAENRPVAHTTHVSSVWLRYFPAPVSYTHLRAHETDS